METRPPVAESAGFFRNSLIAYLTFGAGFLLRLLLYRVIFLKLGIELFATWGILKSFLILPAFLQQAAHTAIFIRTARDSKKVQSISEFLALIFLASIPVAIIVFLFAPAATSFFHVEPHLRDIAITGFRLSAIIFLLESFSQLFIRILQGLGRYKDSGILTIAAQFLNSGVAIFAVYSGYQILSLLFIDIVTAALSCLITIVRLKSLLPSKAFSFSFNNERMKALCKETAAQLLTVLNGRLLWELDPWLVPRFFGLAAMSSYYLARRIPYTSSDLLWAGAEPIVPVAARLGASRKQIIRRIHWAQVGLAIAVGGCLWIFAPQILNLWIRKPPQDAVFFMRILVLARTIDFLPTTILYSYFASGKTFRIARITLGAALVKLVGSGIAIFSSSLELLIFTTLLGALFYCVVLLLDAQVQLEKVPS
jgi:O-antigen/teichoic acid export membrane protein